MSFFGLKLGSKQKSTDKSTPKVQLPQQDGEGLPRFVWLVFLIPTLGIVAILVMRYWDKISQLIPH